MRVSLLLFCLQMEGITPSPSMSRKGTPPDLSVSGGGEEREEEMVMQLAKQSSMTRRQSLRKNKSTRRESVFKRNEFAGQLRDIFGAKVLKGEGGGREEEGRRRREGGGGKEDLNEGIKKILL